MPFADEPQTAAVVPYRAQWPRDYGEPAGRLRDALGAAVPAITRWAPPPCRNRAEVSSGRRCAELVFAPPPGARVCNVHLRPAGAASTRYALLFRDYLRADAAARTAWGTFKVCLAHSVPDLGAYTRHPRLQHPRYRQRRR